MQSETRPTTIPANRLPLLATGLILAAMLALSAWAWYQLPPGAQVVIHWGADLQPTRTAPPTVAFLLLPGVVVLLALVFLLVHAVEPRRGNLLRSQSAFAIAWVASVTVAGVGHVLLVAGALELLASPWPILIVLGLMFLVLGLQLPRVKSNFTLGVRLPWTLSSELSWRRTNRLGGRLMVVLGVVTIAASIVLEPMHTLLAVLIGVGVLIAVLVPYSYVVWRSDPDRDDGRQTHA